jgi:hypothetical protein
MAIEVLSLPIDVPWKRLCVSTDMIDQQVCDRQFPFRWRSSVAVFAYEPPAEHQTVPDSLISYLKVAYTITGFQPEPEEVGIKDRRVDSHWNDPALIENYKEIVSQYYGCYGAILEVAVAPPGPREVRDRIPILQLPYFADFEPKKRELYELVSETGEMMSRSLENVNVRKGITTSDSHEVLDIFGGFSQQFQYAGTGGGHSVTGQWGTRDVNQEEYADIRTTDRGRETRETFSHTTQLTQMYHQFTSYHLGTNRAVFFLLPRPHIVQAEATFVNGPRLLEGIQEVFLVVVRPRDMAEVCVEAYLETAHVASEPILVYETSTGTLTLHVEKHASDTSGSFGDDSNTTYAEGSETYTPPDGWEVDLDRSGGYHIESASGHRIEDYRITEAARDHVTAYGKVSAWFEDRTWPESNVSHNGSLDLVVTVYIRKKKPTTTGYNQNLWLTGRGVCCCGEHDPAIVIPSVVWEHPFKSNVDVAVGGLAKMRTLDANTMRAEIGRQMVRSINHPDRYALGTVRFAETQFLARALSQLVRSPNHPDNRPVRDIPGLSEAIKAKITQRTPDISRGRVMQMSIGEQMDRYHLTADETAKLRRAMLGLEGPAPAPNHRWDPPPSGGHTDRPVPNVAGLALEQAQRRLRAASLLPGAIAPEDSAQPSGTVLSQDPAAGTKVPPGTTIRLTVASGLSVQIPEIVGDTLTQALCRLASAGLKSDPRIVVKGKMEAARGFSGRVTTVDPPERTYVTPNAEVTLELTTQKPA